MAVAVTVAMAVLVTVVVAVAAAAAAAVSVVCGCAAVAVAVAMAVAVVVALWLWLWLCGCGSVAVALKPTKPPMNSVIPKIGKNPRLSPLKCQLNRICYLQEYPPTPLRGKGACEISREPSNLKPLPHF